MPFVEAPSEGDAPAEGGSEEPTPAPPLVKPIPEVDPPPAEVEPGMDPLTATDWAINKINMPELGVNGANREVITAVVDTGVDYNHEDLKGSMWRKDGEVKAVGYDFAHDNAKPYDLVYFDLEGCLKDILCRFGMNQAKYLVNPGHGTHCAGHVAAVANNSLGIQGVGAGAQLMALKFFYDVGEPKAGAGDDAAAIKAIDFAVKNGAKVINASWGGNMSREDGEKSELKKALERAREAGVIIVIAAGNSGEDQDNVEKPTYPAAYDLDNLIVVAATNDKDELASFSNYGATSVDIGAPGAKILSTTVGSKYSDLVASAKDEDSTINVEWNGTSMAAPIVAGAVALVWSRHPQLTYKEVRERVLSTARKVPSLEGKVVTGGILDVAAALK